MFGKKILSVVGLLFLGYQISKVSATCEPTYSSGYICTGCEAGDVGYYYVGDQTSLIEVTDANICADDKVKVPGYYKLKDNSVYKVEHTTFIATAAETVADVANCANGKIALDTKKLCLDATNTVAFDSTNSYLFNDASHLISTADNIAIKATGDNSIILDESFDGSDYCIDDNKVIFDDRKKALCDTNASFTEEDCSGYYNCEKGVCTVSNTNVDPRSTCIPVAGNSNNCDVGYYLTIADGSALATSSANTHHLWLCSGESTCTDLTAATKVPIGYLKNSGNPDDFEYINCTKSKCDILKFGDDETCAETADASSNQVATGTLYTNSGNVKLCVYNGGDKSLTLSGTPDEGNFFVSIGSSLFGLTAKSDNFIVVNVDDKGNLTVVKESSAVRYRYILTGDDKREIHSRRTAKNENSAGEICGNGGSPTEFIMNQWDSSPNIDNDKADYYVQEA